MLDFNKLSRDYKREPIKKGEAICKEDLIYLHNELNFTNKQTADILGCSETKIAHFCFKYKLKKTFEQRSIISTQNNKDKWNSFSEEKRQAIREKQKARWNNKTEEEKEAWKKVVSKNSKKMWENMSEEQYISMTNKMIHSAILYNEGLTKEQKENRIKAFQNTWYGAPEQEKLKRNKKNSDKKKQWWSNVSEETLQNRSKKRKQTMSNKPSEELQEIQHKIYETKKKNNTFNCSNDESIIYKKLKERFKTVLRQFKDKRYPFACDFYIPELDLFIEYQGTWTHGKEPFDSTNEKHRNILEIWKNRQQQLNFKTKNKNFYTNAINIWTVKDPEKRKIVKEQNLNWIEFFNLEEFNRWFKEI